MCGENEKDTLEEIQKIYTDVSEWLKFAEAKHAGMFAVWTAVLIAIMSRDGFWEIITIGNVLIVIAIIGGILISLVSFFPFLNHWSFIREKCYHKYQLYSGNSVFYQAIYVDTYSLNGVEDSIQKYMVILSGCGLTLTGNKLENDYLKQIVEISAVGTIKIYLFGLAATYMVLVLLVFLLIMIIA